MIFKPELAQAIVISQKTQSRRLVGEWDQAEYDTDGNIYRVIAWPSAAHKLAYPGRTRYQVGKVYSIQPGRTRAGIGRFTLLEIRRERVNEISENDAIAEGIKLGEYYWDEGPISKFANLWDFIHRSGSFAGGAMVWVLVFEVCK